MGKIFLFIMLFLGSAIISFGQTVPTSCTYSDGDTYYPQNMINATATPDGSAARPFADPEVLDWFQSNDDPYSELGSFNQGTELNIWPGFYENSDPHVPTTVEFSITAGALPPGLGLITVTCPDYWQPILKGAPNTTGSFIFTITTTVCEQGECFTGSDQYHMNVLQKFSQGDPSWASSTYGGYDPKICQSLQKTKPKSGYGYNCTVQHSGCLETAMAMLLSGAGLYLPPVPPDVPYVTPTMVNDLAIGKDFSLPGFARGSTTSTGFALLPGNTTNQARQVLRPQEPKLAWKDGPSCVKKACVNEAGVSNTIVDKLEETLAQGFPVIVHVPHRAKITPSTPANTCTTPSAGGLGHFVIVTNAQLDQTSPIVDSDGTPVRFYINDPGCRYGKYLDEFMFQNDLKFDITGYLTDPTDFSLLSISSSDNVEITLTDSNGELAGYDPASGQHVQEIANSFYFLDSDDDPETGESMNSANVVDIETPVSGSYRLSITGGVGGEFGITVDGIAMDGSVPTRQLIRGTYVPGSTISYSISYSSTPGEQLVVQPTPLIGDLNGDGKVDCSDLAIVKAAFGSVTGGSGFDPRADVNSDGLVNILDLATVSKEIPAGTVCH